MKSNNIISIINGKGGVGKTSLISNIGGILAKYNKKILLIDLDPQGNLAEDLGYVNTEVDDKGSSLLTSLNTKNINPVKNIRNNLDVIVGGDCLHDVSAMLSSRKERDNNALLVLKQILDNIKHNYNLILIDCPPGNECLQQLALIASNGIIIPIKTDASSRKGLQEVAKRYSSIRTYNPSLLILGVILFGINLTAKRIIQQSYSNIREDLGDTIKIFNNGVRHVEAAANDTRNRGKLAYEVSEEVKELNKIPWYKRKNKKISLANSNIDLANDYFDITNELIELLKEKF